MLGRAAQPRCERVVGEEALDRRGEASRSPGSTSRPFSPSTTTSATPPVRVAITGVPTASASTTECGKFSHTEESSAASPARKSSSTPWRWSGPRKRAWPSCSSAARSGPSPAIASATPARRAASIPMSSAFCAVSRPAKTSVGPSKPSSSRSSSRGRSSGIGGAGFASTVTRSASAPQPSARSRMYAEGVTT